ncbi:MAG: hypothetical protein ACTSQJ_10715 [Promethearchaeota archaeon]
MPDYNSAVNYLMETEPAIIAVAIIEGKQDIVYQTDNWDISPDVGRVISAWNSMNAQFIMISGVKYSMLQCTSERIVATSIRGEGHIVGAKDEERKMIAYVEPDGNMNTAYMETARALQKLSSKTSYLDDSSQLGKKAQIGVGTTSVGYGANIDPQLKSEIQSFLEWIKDPDGLGGYINYYLQQNNVQIISELSKIYTDLRQIFGV